MSDRRRRRTVRIVTRPADRATAIVDGDPQLTITTRADVPGTRADGGNTRAANRLLGALDWLAHQKPGIYDGLDVPLQTTPAPQVQRRRWAG